MRFLIVFAAALACASAAPSHLLPYAAYTAIPAIPFGAVRTVSSGDIQGAVIDAHVKAADFAQATVDKARLLSEQAVGNLNNQVITTVDQGKERLTDAFWATEDKKWQALDALKTAEAQIDGAIASKADILANSAVGAPYLAAAASLAPIAPVVYSGYSSPALNSFSSQTIIHSHPEAAKAELESVKVDAHVKAADFAQATVDKARLLSEQAAENLNTQFKTTVDQGKERLADAFWATEDKKWQALNALQTAEAQIDGAIASKADILANSAVGAPYLAAASLAPIAPVVYSGYSSPALNSFSSQTIIQSNLEAAKAELESVKVDAHVKAADFAQATVDKARLLSEQAAENLNTQVKTTVDQGKERLADAFWATEDKKWQALNALQTAEAQIGGAIASKADILANSAVGAPYLAAASLAPIAPVVYSGYSSPALNSFSSQTIIQSNLEAAKAELESVKVEAAAKAAESAKEAESAKAKSAEAVSAAASAAAELKSEADKALAALTAPAFAPVAVAGALPYTAGFGYSGVAISPAFGHAVALNNPGLKYFSTVQHVEPTATTFYKTKW